MTTAFRYLSILAILLILAPLQARGGEVSFFTRNGERISSVLPDSWRPLTGDELSRYLEGRIPPATGTVLAGYVKPGGKGNTAILFVFHALSDKPVSEEQQHKMFSWFKKNREVLKNMLPAPVSGMTLENLEYLQDRQTILFETIVTMPDQRLHGAFGIVFTRKGYLNIIGYETDGAQTELPVLVEFIKNVSLPHALEVRQTLDACLAWIWIDWQQIAGAAIILLIYGYAFLHRGKSPA